MAKSTQASNFEEFKAQILKELREQLAADALRAKAQVVEREGESADKRDFRETREAVHSRFQKAAQSQDVIHTLATAFRKAGHHMLSGKDVHRALELVAEELEKVAFDAQAVAAPESEPVPPTQA